MDFTLQQNTEMSTQIHIEMIITLNYVSFGIWGNVLDWFSSYLRDRTQSVQIGDNISEAKELKLEVLQGSVLGPILFTIYTMPLEWLIQNDTQLYIAFRPVDLVSKADGIRLIENCVTSIKKVEGETIYLN